MIWNLFIFLTILIVEFSLPKSAGTVVHVLLGISFLWIARDVLKRKQLFNKSIS